MVPDHWSNDAMVSMDRCGLLTNIVQNCDYLPNSRKYSINPAIDDLLTKIDFSPCVQATGLKASLVRWARGESLVFVKPFSSIKMKPCGDH